jgi:2-(3-amino-3-carboxypropyl)histidine synthase
MEHHPQLIGKMDFSEIQKKYDFEIEKIVNEINSNKYKKVLLQFPDGLKQYATQIVDILSEKTKCEFRIWLGSCFGACDIPNTESDLVIQFGHAPWGVKKFNEV